MLCVLNITIYVGLGQTSQLPGKRNIYIKRNSTNSRLLQYLLLHKYSQRYMQLNQLKYFFHK